MAKRFYKRYSPLLKTDPNVRSGYRCYFARENKKGETLSTWVDVQPRYKIKDAYGNVYMFEKKRNVNKVLRKFGYKEPQGASAFYWSDDGAFEAGNLKVTKKGKAVKFSRRSEDGSWASFWSYPDGSVVPVQKTKRKNNN